MINFSKESITILTAPLLATVKYNLLTYLTACTMMLWWGNMKIVGLRCSSWCSCTCARVTVCSVTYWTIDWRRLLPHLLTSFHLERGHMTKNTYLTLICNFSSTALGRRNVTAEDSICMNILKGNWNEKNKSSGCLLI